MTQLPGFSLPLRWPPFSSLRPLFSGHSDFPSSACLCFIWLYSSWKHMPMTMVSASISLLIRKFVLSRLDDSQNLLVISWAVSPAPIRGLELTSSTLNVLFLCICYLDEWHSPEIQTRPGGWCSSGWWCIPVCFTSLVSFRFACFLPISSVP